MGGLRHLFGRGSLPEQRSLQPLLARLHVRAPAAALPVHLHQPADAPSLCADGAAPLDGAADGSARLAAAHPGLCGFVVFHVAARAGALPAICAGFADRAAGVFAASRAETGVIPKRRSARFFRADRPVRQLLRFADVPRRFAQLPADSPDCAGDEDDDFLRRPDVGGAPVLRRLGARLCLHVDAEMGAQLSRAGAGRNRRRRRPNLPPAVRGRRIPLPAGYPAAQHPRRDG